MSDYSTMDADQQNVFNVDVVQLVFSAAATLAVAAYTVCVPAALSVVQPPVETVVPSAIVCTAAGFCAFMLWVLMSMRGLRRSYLRMAHLSVVLMLFASAAYKQEHTALLAVTLLSEGHTVVVTLRRLQVLPRILLFHTSSRQSSGMRHECSALAPHCHI